MKRFPHNIQIESVQHFKDFKIFYNVPFQIYHDDSNWVPPFWNEIKNFFKKKIHFGHMQNANYLSLRKITKLSVELPR